MLLFSLMGEKNGISAKSPIEILRISESPGAFAAFYTFIVSCQLQGGILLNDFVQKC